MVKNNAGQGFSKGSAGQCRKGKVNAGWSRMKQDKDS